MVKGYPNLTKIYSCRNLAITIAILVLNAFASMVNTKSLILYYGLNFRLKYNNTNTNTIYSFKSIYN